MCNIREQYDEYKRTRPSQILKSESRKSNVVAAFENEYVNPFDIALDRTMLINLSSGSEMETPTKLLNLQQDSITIAKEFLQEELLLSSKKFFDPIPRNINKSTIVMKKYITKKNSLTTAQVNRDVLADLLRLTMKNGQINNFKEVAKYPLYPIPLSLSFPDSAKRSPVKSSLMKIIDYTQVVQDYAYANVGAYIVDLMVSIQAVDMFLTVEELINGVPSIILRDGGRVDLVADSYREISWKSSTRAQKNSTVDNCLTRKHKNVFQRSAKLTEPPSLLLLHLIFFYNLKCKNH